MVETILSSPFVKDIVLPFLLVFALVFAILQKSEILGKGKRQVDAIVALVVGLLVITVGSAVNIITGLVPILAVGLVVLLVFFLLFGFAFKEGEFKVSPVLQWTIGVIAAIAVIIGVLYFTGSWDYLRNLVGGGTSSIVTNIVFIVLIIVAVVVVVGFGGKSETKPST
jgi:peptidoglycan/LPS O-acetylase OafA/YrhL